MGNVLFVLVLLLMGLFAVAGYGNRRAWARRPRRLCTNCHGVRQPLQTKAKTFYCPSCQKESPIPLSSPAAQAHFHQTGRWPAEA